MVLKKINYTLFGMLHDDCKVIIAPFKCGKFNQLSWLIKCNCKIKYQKV